MLAKQLRQEIYMLEQRREEREYVENYMLEQRREDVNMLEQRREELCTEMEQFRIYNGMNLQWNATTIQPQNKVYEARTTHQDRNIEQSAGEDEVINCNDYNFGSNIPPNDHEKNSGEEIVYNENFYQFYGHHDEYRQPDIGLAVIDEIPRHYNEM